MHGAPALLSRASSALGSSAESESLMLMHGAAHGEPSLLRGIIASAPMWLLRRASMLGRGSSMSRLQRGRDGAPALLRRAMRRSAESESLMLMHGAAHGEPSLLRGIIAHAAPSLLRLAHAATGVPRPAASIATRNVPAVDFLLAAVGDCSHRPAQQHRH